MVDHGMFALDLEDGVSHPAGFEMHPDSEEEGVPVRTEDGRGKEEEGMAYYFSNRYLSMHPCSPEHIHGHDHDRAREHALDDFYLLADLACLHAHITLYSLDCVEVA